MDKLQNKTVWLILFIPFGNLTKLLQMCLNAKITHIKYKKVQLEALLIHKNNVAAVSPAPTAPRLTFMALNSA